MVNIHGSLFVLLGIIVLVSSYIIDSLNEQPRLTIFYFIGFFLIIWGIIKLILRPKKVTPTGKHPEEYAHEHFQQAHKHGRQEPQHQMSHSHQHTSQHHTTQHQQTKEHQQTRKGTNIIAGYCRKCGNAIKNIDNFCSQCGDRIFHRR